MGMKTGKVTSLVSCLFSSLSFPVLLLILFSLSLTSSSSSVSYKHDNLFVSTYDFMVVIRKSSGVPLFFMLSFIIITVSLGSRSSSSTSGDDLDRYFPSFPLVSHEINTTMIIINQDHENYDESSRTPDDEEDIEDCYNHGFPLVSHEINTAMVIINQERENYDDSGSAPDDEEYIDDGVEDIEGCYNHGYDGSEEDNEDGFRIETTEDENDDKDLERRIEEFIAKVNQKWREEWLADRLLCLPAP